MCQIGRFQDGGLWGENQHPLSVVCADQSSVLHEIRRAYRNFLSIERLYGDDDGEPRLSGVSLRVYPSSQERCIPDNTRV